jgi:cobalt-zinc-cadmium efflux system protein
MVATDLPVLSAHVVVDDSCFHDGHLPTLLDKLQECLAGHSDVEHCTSSSSRPVTPPREHAAHA